jgi:protein-disulfide isomerase
MVELARQKTPITAADWVLGPWGARITLLEYGDFECVHCAAARPVLQELVASHPATFRLVYRHFPVTTIHPHAERAAEAAEAAGAQRRFWEMHDAIFAHREHLAFENLRRYASAIGLNLARFDRDMTTHRYLGEVKKDFRSGIIDGVNGTPTIFINGLRYDGPRDRRSILSAAAEQEVPWEQSPATSKA